MSQPDDQEVPVDTGNFPFPDDGPQDDVPQNPVPLDDPAAQQDAEGAS